MPHRWLKFPKAFVGMKVKSKLLSRAHRVPCLRSLVSSYYAPSILKLWPSWLILLKWPTIRVPTTSGSLPCCFSRILSQDARVGATVDSYPRSNATFLNLVHNPAFKFHIQKLRAALLNIQVLKACFWVHRKSSKVVPNSVPCIY